MILHQRGTAGSRERRPIRVPPPGPAVLASSNVADTLIRCYFSHLNLGCRARGIELTEPRPVPAGARRALYGKKPRRKKGDKSKKARLATLVAMYTLRCEPGGTKLLGPVNRRVYASAPKRHAFAIARREADKRGFTKDSGKPIQILTDRDEDLAHYAQEYFPAAIHAVDVVHVLEYIYQAGDCLYKEDAPSCKAGSTTKKEQLCNSKLSAGRGADETSLSGAAPNLPRQQRPAPAPVSAIRYLEKRLAQMNYKRLADQDLELGTGMVGEVKNLIGPRFDFGGRRWIRERVEALLPSHGAIIFPGCSVA